MRHRVEHILHLSCIALEKSEELSVGRTVLNRNLLSHKPLIDCLICRVSLNGKGLEVPGLVTSFRSVEYLLDNFHLLDYNVNKIDAIRVTWSRICAVIEVAVAPIHRKENRNNLHLEIAVACDAADKTLGLIFMEGKTMRILMAGEQHEFGDLLLPFLARKGHSLLLAQTVDELLGWIRSEPLDVVIMDLDLPAKDSFKASEELRHNLDSISKPVIVVAHNERLMPQLKELGKWLRQNAAAVLYKPLDYDELDTALVRLQEDEAERNSCLKDEILSRLVDPKSPDEETKRAEFHLLHCLSCQIRYAELQRTDCAREDSAVNDSTTGMHDHFDTSNRATRPRTRYLATRKAKIAASLMGLALAASAPLAGRVVYHNRELASSARPSIDKTETLSQIDEERVLAERPQDEVEDEARIIGQLVMYEYNPVRLEVPENVEHTARALIKKHYYDESAIEKALRNEDIWEVFKTLNLLEIAGAKSPFVVKATNRILSPYEVRILEGELSGSVTGIGIWHQSARGSKGERVIGFVRESPAEKAGLRVGDVITEIDGIDLRDLNLSQVNGMFRGPVNTTVKLRVSRENGPGFEVSVVRQRIETQRTLSSIVGAETVYIRVQGPGGTVVEDLSAALNEWKLKNAQKLILDLRGIAGTSLQAATGVAGLFLPERALIAMLRERSGERPILAEGPGLWEGPIVVLVDNRTISGGELIAAALQGAGRAVIAGERTPGKGSVQTVYAVAQDHAVQLTTGILAGPNGLLYNKSGLKPDIEVVGVETNDHLMYDGDILEDMVVRVALESLECEHEKAGN